MADPLQDLPDLPPLLDYAILDPLLDSEQLIACCDASRERNIRAICGTPARLPTLRNRLGGGEGPRLIAAIDFPFGTLPASLRLAEAEWAAANGADELDVVPDFSALADGDSGRFAEDLAALCDLGLPLRVVLDMARFSDGQLELAVEAAIDAGASGVQTGNGFGPPCHPDQVSRLKQLCRGRCAIKAAGGIHSLELVHDLVAAGANLLGTSSAPQLLQAQRQPIG